MVTNLAITTLRRYAKRRTLEGMWTLRPVIIYIGWSKYIDPWVWCASFETLPPNACVSKSTSALYIACETVRFVNTCSASRRF